MRFQQTFRITPASKRVREFIQQTGFLGRLYFDPEGYANYNPKAIRTGILENGAVLLLEKLKVDLPQEIILKPVGYANWRIYRSFYNKPDIIRKILEESIVDITPSDINIYKIIKKRPFFWKSLFAIIQQISDFNYSEEEQERRLADMVDKATMNYTGSLDGLYDLFVLTNFPNIWETYRRMDYYERLDVLGMLQQLIGVNVYKNLQDFRNKKISRIELTPKDPRKIPKDMRETKGVDPVVLDEAQQKLMEDIERDRMSGYKRKINTDLENRQFVAGKE